MKATMKKVCVFFKTTLCVLLILCISGCWNSRELDTLAIVMGIGIDKPDQNGKVKVTAQIVRPSEIKSSKKDEGSGSTTQAFWNIDNTGDTIFGTLREMTEKSSRKLYFPHNQVLVFGRSIAEEGIQEYIDFFNRDHETRSEIFVLVSQGKASDILGVKSQLEKVPANNISKLIQVQAAATSQIKDVKLRDFLERHMSKTTAPIVPIAEISGEGDEKSVVISGMAVFKGDKLIGDMNKIESRGILWVLGEVKSGAIEVEGPANDKVCLEIIRASGKMVPEIDNKKIKIKVSISEEGNIAEQTGPESLYHPSEIASLQKKNSEAIRNEVTAAVKKAQSLNADVFGFGDAVHQKYPEYWKSIEGKWDEIFPGIDVEVSVDAKIRLMGRILKPALPE